jgi:hypothetical protein
MKDRADWLRSEGRWVGSVVSTAISHREAHIHMGYQTTGGEWRSLCGQTFASADKSESAPTCARCVSGMTLNNLAREDDTAESDVPTTACSVVWYQGHPWVLDGGTQRTRYVKRWVGVRKDGTIGSMSQRQMNALLPGTVYEHPDDD